MPLNDVEKQAFREIPRRFFSGVRDYLFLILIAVAYLVILGWMMIDSYCDLRDTVSRDVRPVPDLSRATEQLEIDRREQLGRLRDIVTRLQLSDQYLHHLGTKVDGLSRGLDPAKEGVQAPTEFSVLFTEMTNQIKKVVEEQEKLLARQNETMEKLEGIRAVVRRGNLYAPGINKE